MLFHRNPESRRLGKQFYGVRIRQVSRLKFINDKDRGWSQPPQYMLSCPAHELDVDDLPVSRIFKEFPYLAPRMVRLLERMESWKPRSFGQLFIPGYAGRFEWWIAMFGVFFGVVSLLSLIASLASVGLSAYQIQLSKEASTAPQGSSS